MRAGASGSKLIVTTRYKGVVSVTGTCSAYPLQELSYDDCLSLFTRQALGARNLDAYPHLKEVGEEIVKRCKGPWWHVAQPTKSQSMGRYINKQDMGFSGGEKSYSSRSQVKLPSSSFSFEAVFCLLLDISKRLRIRQR
ncbi:hypothetical protein CK203_054371 [Vitis vinifera]|uniref:Uncharacterized protein n=1 Tax=Vitis vinifera TaxID=29760 RepID=A0A438GG79_VITVI|nr:hypothetical protein CK203_054371 [Vitis vinifera]